MQTAKHETRLVREYPSPEGIMYSPWLLEYLLKHEVREALLVNLAKLKVYLLYFGFNPLVPDGLEHHLILPDYREIIVIEIDYPLGMLNYGNCIRGNEILTVTHTYQQR